jgi:hypothetical protein
MEARHPFKANVESNMAAIVQFSGTCVVTPPIDTALSLSHWQAYSFEIFVVQHKLISAEIRFKLQQCSGSHGMA